MPRLAMADACRYRTFFHLLSSLCHLIISLLHVVSSIVFGPRGTAVLVSPFIGLLSEICPAPFEETEPRTRQSVPLLARYDAVVLYRLPLDPIFLDVTQPDFRAFFTRKCASLPRFTE
jgi:hypothetical protein